MCPVGKGGVGAHVCARAYIFAENTGKYLENGFCSALQFIALKLAALLNPENHCTPASTVSASPSWLLTATPLNS